MGIQSKGDKIMGMIAHMVMIILSAAAVIPFMLLFMSSITNEQEVTLEGYGFWPKQFSLEAYKYIFEQWGQIGRAYGITLIVTFVGTTLAILLVAMLSYGLVQKDVPGIRVVFLLVLLTMLFNGGIVPTYYVYNNLLHVKNTIWGLVLPNLLMNGFTVILVKNYFEHNIPAELIEAAELDGANQFHILFKLVMPLATPILATVGLLTGVAYWNDWTNGLYYITDDKLFSIQQLLNKMNENIQFLANNASLLGGTAINTALPSGTVRMAIAVVAILPVIIIYPFFQKYFAKGITMGAVKG
ncbi:carbohydrate ABC transporter permease [Anaerobium acetethylicum]|uniref:Putative aldouronate transport system permease protein n=1 Tax=Anaerobium acetethylicum TaxID=1619234 RepID=A0A1D3TYH9_9FIRM|nr:carbohydrate ABC transporter permease [Anaerobium acetethylicum]SCP99520.1 putative aldouronate transport system permease protein [Anaerobium acetethylicum]